MSDHQRYPQGDPDCEHPGEYLRMGDHPDVTGRWVPEDIDRDTLYCLRCEMPVPDVLDQLMEEAASAALRGDQP